MAKGRGRDSSDDESDSEYENVTPEEHVLLKADMYLGNTERIGREVFIYDPKEKKILKDYVIDIPEALEKIIIEILENATDNKKRSIDDGIDPGNIIVNVDNETNTITVQSHGRPIPMLINKKSGLYNPEFVFDNMFTGSNINKKGNKIRTGSGTNGLGAKLTVLFSTFFCLEVGDAINGLYFKKIWEDNKRVKSDTVVKKYKKENSFVKVTFIPDLKKFGYSSKYHFDDTFVNFIKTRCIFLSFTHNIEFIFNDEQFCYDISKYSKLFIKKGTKSIIYEKDNYKLCLYYTPDNSSIISFCNGVYTYEGGIHVNNAYNAFSKDLMKKLNDANKDNGIKINISHIKRHISLIISVFVEDPGYAGQMKSKLTRPNIKITIPNDIIDKITKWGLLEKLNGTINDAISTKIIKKTDGKKVKNIGKFKGKKANYAGGKHSKDCVLYLIEGDSAEGYAKYIRSFTKGGANYIGTFPLRGKLLNVKKCSLEDIAKSEEINRLKKVLGLKDGQYNDFSNLRYGKIRILTDQDDDGIHIACLLINLFHSRFEGILDNQLVSIFETPLLRAKKGNVTLPFYSKQEFDAWCEENNPKGWKIKYFKGLGSNQAKDVKADLKNERLIKLVKDRKADEAIELAFSKNLADDRKNKITEWKQPKLKTFRNKMNISYLMDNGLMRYWITNIQRSIPAIDGFKVSTRKVFWACYKLINKNNSTKLSQLVGEVSKKSDYHHGEDSIEKMIKKMAMKYVGTNNLNYFKPKGDYGDRDAGPKRAAASRYIFTGKEQWVDYVFIKDDNDILEYNYDDKGNKLEPKFYLPIIPTILLNGTHGVSTGWSTKVPPHNPKDLIYCMKRFIKDEKEIRLKPFYRNFKGKIKISKTGFSTYGNYETDGNIVDVSELPIGLWNKKYENFIIEELQENEKLVKSYKDNCTVDHKTYVENVNFILKFFNKEDAEKQDHDSLNLITSFSYTNMVLLNYNNDPVRYNTVNDIAYDFYVKRLPYYQIRKDYIINKIKEEIKEMEYKIKFITLVAIDKKIEIRNRYIKDIHLDLDNYELPYYVYEKVTGKCLSTNEINKLTNKIKEATDKLNKIENKDVKDMWLEELDRFEEFLDKHYTCF